MIVKIIQAIISKIFEWNILKSLDRTLGFFFGILEGFVIVGLFVFLFELIRQMALSSVQLGLKGADNLTIVDISEEERIAFFEDVNHAAKAIHAAFHPDKLNYGAYGDTGCHLHMHLCPKYNGGDEWGGTFTMNPDKVYLTDDEYQDMINKIISNL